MRHLLPARLAALALALAPGPGRADLLVSPRALELSIPAGEEGRGVLRLTNASDHPIAVRATLCDSGEAVLAPGTGGRGRGRMNMFYATGLPGYARYGYGAVPTAVTVADEAEMLRKQAAVLEQELQLVKERLGVLEEETKEKGK